jgi:FKBP-type peptidyl-prolyl cis-trans isomerase
MKLTTRSLGLSRASIAPTSIALASIALASIALALLGCNRRAEPEVRDKESPALAQTAPNKAADKPQTHEKSPQPEKKSMPAPSDVAAPPSDAEKTASGLTSKVITPGTGKERPGPADKVTVHYTGWTKDGKMFDSSVLRGKPATFPLNGVIKGWTEGLQLMVTGETRRFWIPGALAYGENPAGGRPGGQLTFDVELLSFVGAPKSPKDVAAPPANAKKTASGLAYLEVKKGNPAGKSPKATSTVKVHYSGWTKDGRLFDSSEDGEPVSFPLDQVIKGWTEGVQLMKEGSRYRFWIPGSLAYGDEPNPMRPGAPFGQLTFEVELLSVEN